jgi:hypothetical protein
MQGHGWKSFHKERQRERTFWFKRPWHPNAYLEKIGNRDFNTFVRTVLEDYPGYLTQMYGWYATPGKVDFIGRTESLIDDLLAALDRAEIAVDEEAVRNTDKVNTSPSRIDRPTWDDDLRAAVRRLEAPVFERFGYE